jgi:molybdopterin-guanine dinucleotide biosynthesis protein A
MVHDPLVAAMVLTGGASTRMGVDKALLEVAGLPNAARLAKELSGVAAAVIEVGPGWSGAVLRALEEPPGAGPLAAVAAGAAGLGAAGWEGPVLVVACDMPLATGALFELLAAYPSERSVVPFAGGRLQPLCARWSWEDLRLSEALCRRGERSMKALLQEGDFTVFGPSKWPRWLSERHFFDVDTPEQAAQAGLAGPFAVA